MPINKHIEVDKSRLEQVPVKHGQTLHCPDTGDMYMDTKYGDRVKVSDIIILDTEEDRLDILAPIHDKLYLIRENYKLYSHNGIKWISLSNEVVSMKSNYTITEPVDKISILIQSYNKNTDTLFVYVNSVYLEEDFDYTVDESSQYILPTNDGKIWNASETEPQIFNFVVLKNIRNVKSAEAYYSENEEIQMLKKENSLLMYAMMVNNMNIKNILTEDKILYFYKNNLWNIDMLKSAKTLGYIVELPE